MTNYTHMRAKEERDAKRKNEKQGKKLYATVFRLGPNMMLSYGFVVYHKIIRLYFSERTRLYDRPKLTSYILYNVRCVSLGTRSIYAFQSERAWGKNRQVDVSESQKVSERKSLICLMVVLRSHIHTFSKHNHRVI